MLRAPYAHWVYFQNPTQHAGFQISSKTCSKKVCAPYTVYTLTQHEIEKHKKKHIYNSELIFFTFPK